jgi:hypothetical protein
LCPRAEHLLAGALRQRRALLYRRRKLFVLDDKEHGQGEKSNLRLTYRLFPLLPLDCSDPVQHMIYLNEILFALETSDRRTVRCAWLLISKRNLTALEFPRFQRLSRSTGQSSSDPLSVPHHRRGRKLPSASLLDRNKTPRGRSPAACIQVRRMSHLPFTSTRA